MGLCQLDGHHIGSMGAATDGSRDSHDAMGTSQYDSNSIGLGYEGSPEYHAVSPFRR